MSASLRILKAQTHGYRRPRSRVTLRMRFDGTQSPQRPGHYPPSSLQRPCGGHHANVRCAHPCAVSRSRPCWSSTALMALAHGSLAGARCCTTAILLAASCVRFLAATPAYAQPVGPPPVPLPDFIGLVKKVGPAVVNISTTRTVRAEGPGFGIPDLSPDDPVYELLRRFFSLQPYAREFQARNLGSGFIISAGAYPDQRACRRRHRRDHRAPNRQARAQSAHDRH